MTGTDTIVALATAPAPAGVAVLRLSGPLALAIACSVTGRAPAEFAPGQMRFGALRSAGGERLDRGYAVFFQAPRSFTGEDVLELQVHGSLAVVDGLIQACCELGAKPALPGEFTRRAFEHGRLDLVQAEGILDLVSARTEAARRAALAHLDGALSQRLQALRQPLVAALAMVEARLDFAHEDGVDDLDRVALGQALGHLHTQVQALRTTARAGRIRLQGARVVLYGAPNAGKSTLLNALVGADRALVDARPGTTRDTIEVQTVLDGQLVTWIDTAGVRDTADPVEREGTRRARREAESADLVIWLQDSAAPVAELPGPPGRDVLRVRSKADTGLHPEVAAHAQFASALAVAAPLGLGVGELRQRVVTAVQASAHAGSGGDVALSRERHAEGLRVAAEAIGRAQAALDGSWPLELVAADLRDAAAALGEVTGEVAADDVLEAVFGQFCIGK